MHELHFHTDLVMFSSNRFNQAYRRQCILVVALLFSTQFFSSLPSPSHQHTALPSSSFVFIFFFIFSAVQMIMTDHCAGTKTNMVEILYTFRPSVRRREGRKTPPCLLNVSFLRCPFVHRTFLRRLL